MKMVKNIELVKVPEAHKRGKINDFIRGLYFVSIIATGSIFIGSGLTALYGEKRVRDSHYQEQKENWESVADRNGECSKNSGLVLLGLGLGGLGYAYGKRKREYYTGI